MALVFSSGSPAGGPRSAPQILGAAREVLSAQGYAALTIEAVAAAAGVGKSTIYRWWPSKEALVADALAEIFRAEEIPDLGDTRAELRHAVDMTIDNYANEDMAASLPALAAGLLHHPELLARFRESFLSRKRENIAAALRRGVRRGDLPDDLDTDLVQDVWAGTIVYRRLMTGAPLDADLAERLVRLVLHSPPLRAPREEAAPGGASPSRLDPAPEGKVRRSPG
ncbi:TetR/AcrR family transcriptional regulator [Streptomyces hoynatensis]|uniref:TetR/AcrR family transcriptional regulator n=1 Tax=Streptomyces hoynatensis TaxID=1141874 RepID=A0A3A9ZBS3_9ACTN|nr:TetR/AcrR family transcriptional regulator [Streptomyces hoynatensis]RKN45559.1 TetR/AcrR family transcriptional regulator [Streptomyces hoynatensis]